MEFNATIENETYTFSSINSSSYLVTSQQNSYILYKVPQWQCADLIPARLLHQLAQIIEDRQSLSS
jgi:hypothetical protein